MMISPSGNPNSCCSDSSAFRAMAISVSTDPSPTVSRGKLA